MLHRIMWFAPLLALLLLPAIQYAEAQTINVTSTTPCFLNETAGPWVWRDCGYGDDYLTGILLPWEWITGGNFSMVLVSIFIMFSYIKYHKMIYPFMVGVMFLPVAFFLFPETFVVWGILMAFWGAGFVLAFILLKQTKEY